MATTRKDYMKDAGFKKLLAQEEFILEVTEVLCKIMSDRGISRKQLADLLGKSKGYVSQLLNGERNLTLRTVADIMHVLGCRGLLTYKEVRKDNESKNNVLIFRTLQTQPKKPIIKWEKGEVLCSDNYPICGNVAIS
jgi:transcriptional regulator with XRE-family HTH domain